MILSFQLIVICFMDKMNNFLQKQLKLSFMNNQYQNPQPRQNEQRYSPSYQMHTPQNVQHQGKGANQQGVAPVNNAYSANVPLPTSLNAHQQLFQQYANSTNSQYANKAPESSPTNQDNHPAYFPPPQQQKSLIQPPQLLRQQETNNPSHNSQRMSQSNQNNENQVREILWGEEQQANTFWQQKFFLIYQKFQWFGSRFQMLKSQYTALSEQLVRVDSQEDWNELKHHHEQFAQKLEEMFQELIAVADQNQQLINQRLEEDDGVWQRRYHELLSNFKALQQKSSGLQSQNQQLKTSQQEETLQNKQNYPQLLSHYQSLQEEYEKLFNAYNKLQEENDQLKTSSQQEKQGPSLEDFENMRNQYQRTLQAISSQNQGLKTECQAFYQQNEQFRQQLNSQAQSLAQLEHINREIQEKSAFIHSLTEQISHWKDNYHQLESHQNDILNKETQKTQELTQKHQRQLEDIHHELNNKESQCAILSKRLNDQLRAREHLVQEHHDELEKKVKSETEKQMRLRGAVEKQLKTLHEEFQKLHSQTSQNDMAKYQLDGLKKKITYLTEENGQLLKSMSAKNQELTALRSISLQVSTYENILEQYKALEKEKMSIQQVNRKQHAQLLQTRKKLSQLEHEFTQYKTITSSPSLKASNSSQLKQFQSELETHTSTRSKLQSQLNKYKQLIEVKQRYIRDLEEENSRTLVKLQHTQRLMNVLKEEHHREVSTLKSKIELVENRNRNSELQFRKDMLQNYQSQVNQLRSTNQDKNKKIKKLEETLHQITTKSTHLEKHTTTYTTQHLLLQNKLSSLDKSNSELLSKLQLACSSVETQQNQLTSLKEKQATLRSQLKNLTIQVEEADNLIKSKNSIILEYEKQVQQFVQKVSELEDKVDGERMEKMERMKRYEEEIVKLKDKLFNSPTEEKRDSLSGGGYRYNSPYINRYLSFGSKQPVQAQQRNQQIQKLESNLIDQMNEQNSRLRSQVLQLTKKVHSLESLSRVIASMQPQSPSSKSASKSKISSIPAQRDVGLINGNIQERLLRFNQRLETCIHDNELIADRNVNLTASQRIATHEKERRQLEIKYQKEIKQLKDQVKSLEEQLANANLTQEKLVDSGLKEFDKYEIMNEQAEKSTKQELEFLRSKLNDHQKTNSSLIKLNEHLKRQLQESLQKGLHSTTEYYKLQWRETEKSLQQDKQKTRKLQDQNNRLKHQNLQRDSKLIKEYELKFFSIEQKLTSLERENTCLKMIRNKNDNEKANYQHDIHVYTADIEAIKASNNAKVAQYEKVTKQLREKCNSMEKDLYEVNNSLKWGAMNGISRTVLTNEKPASSSRRVPA